MKKFIYLLALSFLIGCGTNKPVPPNHTPSPTATMTATATTTTTPTPAPTVAPKQVCLTNAISSCNTTCGQETGVCYTNCINIRTATCNTL